MGFFGTRKRSRRLRRWLTGGVLVLALAHLLPIVLLRWVPPPTSAFMLQARFGGLGEAPACEAIEHRWVGASAIAPDMKLAVIASEDQRFADHWGLDLGAIREAMAEGVGGGRLRGASTITQQLAKNLFLWPERSWVRKGLDAWLALAMEAALPKGRILELYLNTAQFGPCTFGVEAAARRYFGRPAARLQAREAALLAAVLPNPRVLRADAPSSYLDGRAAWIRSQMAQLGLRSPAAP